MGKHDVAWGTLSCYFKRVPFGARVRSEMGDLCRGCPGVCLCVCERTIVIVMHLLLDRRRFPDAHRSVCVRVSCACHPSAARRVPRRHGAPDGLLPFAYHQLPPLIPRPPQHSTL